MCSERERSKIWQFPHNCGKMIGTKEKSEGKQEDENRQRFENVITKHRS